MVGSSVRVSIGVATESAGVFPPLKPVDEPPADASKAGQPQNNEHAGAIKYDGNPTQPRDPAIDTIQGSSKHLPPPALMAQPSPSGPEVMEQDDSAGLRHPTGENVLGRRITRKRPINFRSLTRAVASTEKEESQYVVFVNGYWSDSFAAPQANRRPTFDSGGRVATDTTRESVDVLIPLGSLQSVLGGISIAIKHIDVRFPEFYSYRLCLTILLQQAKAVNRKITVLLGRINDVEALFSSSTGDDEERKRRNDCLRSDGSLSHRTGH